MSCLTQSYPWSMTEEPLMGRWGPRGTVAGQSEGGQERDAPHEREDGGGITVLPL